MNLSSTIWFVGAMIVLAIALSPAMDARADTSFTWHMVQHLGLLFGVSFCLVAARPFHLFASLAPKRFVAGTVTTTRWFHIVANPVFAFVVFVATMWATHFSGLYELSLEHTWVHVTEHVLYLTAGVVFWLPVLAPQPLRPIPYPARLLYLFVALPQGALLAVALASGHRVLYPHYASVNGVAAALADQSNAAAAMWIGGGLIMFVAFLVTFGSWAMRERAIP